MSSVHKATPGIIGQYVRYEQSGTSDKIIL